ncbi:cytochrome P450 [Calocera viscosa TUFC12733]|uniref:Cytochrome P450 n=1 Tax=Calocera viscosa (strain TUFC12733) TaxID=1330018 RepID=A0A167IWG3_CALVF|nr:cytochrome P450 [Calocera viscosa TUFC12733]
MLAFLFQVLGALLAGAVAYHTWTEQKFSRMPPGPPGLPLLGNLLDIPLSQLMFKKLTTWSKTHGPIYSFRLTTRRVVVLSSAKVAGDILDRMSSQSGGRPEHIKAGEYMTRGRLLAFMQRTPLWRILRKAAHDTLNTRAVLRFAPIQTSEARLLTLGLLTHPSLPVSAHAHRFSTSAAMRMLYGLDPISLDGPDPSRPLVEVSDDLFASVKPGKSVVDLMPVLKHVVKRSAFLRRKSDAWYEQVSQLYSKFYWSEPTSSDRTCISLQLREGKYKNIEDVDAVWLVGVLLLASQDMTRVSIQYFFLAMVLHPEVAQQAQKQLNTVVGSRPPSFDDQPRLPWIEAILKETLRWRSPTPGGLAHAASQDIHYGDWVIPKGTMIVANIWAMNHDSELYPDPDKFEPSRSPSS